MPTSYPGGYDAFSNPGAGDAMFSPSHSAQHANVNDAVEAIQAELGLSPSGAEATVTAALALKAPLASPTLTGTPAAPTAVAGTSTTQVATTAFAAAGDASVRQAIVPAQQYGAEGSVLRNLPTMPHPAENLLKQAVWWIDANHASASGQTVRNLGWGGSVLDATCGSTGGADSNDPKYLDFDGTPYIYLSGVTGNSMSVPDETALDIVGDIDIRFKMSMDDWTPAALVYLLGKWSPNSYIVYFNNTGTFGFQWSTNGSDNLNLASTVAVPFVDGATGWLRVTFDVNNGSGGHTAMFYTSTDGLEWTQLGAPVIGSGTTSINSGTSALSVGSYYPDGPNALPGRVYRAQILNGINGTPVLDIDTSVLTTGAATSFPALTGQTVTINRATSGRKSVAVVNPVWMFGTDDYMEVADNDLLDFGATDSFTIIIAARGFTADSGISVAKVTTLAATNGYDFRNFVGSNTIITFMGTGATWTQTSASAVAGPLSVAAMVVDRSGQRNKAYSNGALGNNVDCTAVGTLASAAPLRVGNQSSRYDHGELIAACAFRRALTETEIRTVTDYYAARNL